MPNDPCRCTNRVNHTIPIIVVAASETARREAMAAGADDYLDKPFDVDAFIRKVKRYLNGHGLANVS